MRGAALLLALLASPAAAQGVVRGVVYDSLLGAPLPGAEVWLRGSELRTLTDAEGRFRLEAVPAGRYLLAATHPGLDSAGLYAVTAPVAVASGDTVQVTIATPSLATFWRRRCGTEPPSSAGADSGLVFGVVQDAATGAHLAGAGILASWVRLAPLGRSQVEVEPHDLRVRTDSVGAYYACGVAPDMTVALRAYAGRDSTGLIDVRLGPRGVARQDLTIAQPPATGRLAALRGSAQTQLGRPLAGARVTVREAGTTRTREDGTFLLTDLPVGTQWVSVQAIGRVAVEQAVDLRPGDTAALVVTAGALPVTLDPVRVLGARESAAIRGFEERRKSGAGYSRTEAELARMGTMRSVLTSFPSVRPARSLSAVDLTILLPNPGIGGRGYCVPGLYIDGQRSGFDQLATYRPTDLLGVELYPRPSSAPVEFQAVASGCGVVLVWTKYLEP